MFHFYLKKNAYGKCMMHVWFVIALEMLTNSNSTSCISNSGNGKSRLHVNYISHRPCDHTL